MVSNNPVIQRQNRLMSKVFRLLAVSTTTVTGLTLLRSCCIFFDLELRCDFVQTEPFHSGYLQPSMLPRPVNLIHMNAHVLSMVSRSNDSVQGKPGQVGIRLLQTRQAPVLETQ